MKAQKLLDEILPILYTVKEDPARLQKILTFLKEEIGEEAEELDEPEELEEWLVMKLEEVENESHPEEINNLYDGEGNKMNPESESVSDVCLNCKIHWIDNPEENLLCRIKRFEHRNDKGFKCDAFEKI